MYRTSKPITSHVSLLSWVEKARAKCNPDKYFQFTTFPWLTSARVYWCNGSKEEYDSLCTTVRYLIVTLFLRHQLLNSGTFVKLDKRPGSFLARTDPRDANFLDTSTVVCSNNQVDAGPTNAWMNPVDMKVPVDTSKISHIQYKLDKLFNGCMVGRTMYVIPYCMGPLDSQWRRFGVTITDSPFVVVTLGLMHNVGSKVTKVLLHQ